MIKPQDSQKLNGISRKSQIVRPSAPASFPDHLGISDQSPRLRDGTGNSIANRSQHHYDGSRAMTRSSIEKAAKGLVIVLFILFVYFAIGVLRMTGIV